MNNVHPQKQKTPAHDSDDGLPDPVHVACCLSSLALIEAMIFELLETYKPIASEVIQTINDLQKTKSRGRP